MSIATTMQANVQRDTIALLLAMVDSKVAARRVPDVSVGSTKLPALELDMKPAGPLTLGFDPVTNLLVYQRYGGVGDEPKTEEQFSDYRTIGGLQVAHRV